MTKIVKDGDSTSLKDILGLLWVFAFLILAGVGCGIAVGLYHLILRWFKVGGN